MFQIRIHGRGGQGIVTAAELLAVTAFESGRHAQAFPSFGSERTGAPVVAFCRIDDKPIRRREPIENPDAVIIADPTLIGAVDVFGGVSPDGIVLINTPGELTALPLPADLMADAEGRGTRPPGRLLAVPATDMARRHVGRPFPNAVMLGAFAAMTPVIGLSGVMEAIQHRFSPSLAARNMAAASEAYEYTVAQLARATASTPEGSRP